MVLYVIPLLFATWVCAIWVNQFLMEALALVSLLSAFLTLWQSPPLLVWYCENRLPRRLRRLLRLRRRLVPRTPIASHH